MVGVSGDKPEAQQKFIEKYGLTYPMIPDTSKEIISSFGARAVLGLVAKRQTVLVGPNGRIAHIWPNVQIGGHAAEVVEAIRELSGAGGPDTEYADGLRELASCAI